MREPHLVPESEMSSEELVKRAQLAYGPEPPPLPPAARHKRRQRLLARMALYVPSERNRRIFEQVVIRHKTQEEVAFSESLSRQRVARIVARMRDWIACCGGDEALYGPEQRGRLATHIALRELDHYQRQIEKAIETAGHTVESNRFRFDQNGEKVWHEKSYQAYPRPVRLYKMLLTAILARARLSGAGCDRAGEVDAAGSQAMVVNTEINVNQGTATPPKEALHSDILSESGCVDSLGGGASGTARRPSS